MDRQKQAALQAISGRTEPWAQKLRKELAGKSAPDGLSSPEEEQINMSTNKKVDAVLRALHPEIADLADSLLRRELESGSAEEAYAKLEGMPMEPTGMTSAEEAARMGYEECPHCHGYGSSLKEEAERCTRCGGSGWAKVP